MTAALLDHLWQSSLVAVLLGGLTFLFRNNSAGLRYWLWFLASLKFLLPFSLLNALGRSVFTHPVPESSLKLLARIEPAATPFVAAAPSQSLSWSIAIAMVWGLGFTALILFWLTQAFKLSAIARQAKPLTLESPVPIKATSELLEPGLVGIIRPIILLPESLAERLSRTEIDAILAHELTHWRRRDNLLAMIHMLVEALFWFHPLVWFIGARLVEEREQACDEAVLEDGKKPLDYAQTILKVCRFYFRSPLACASGVSGSNLDRRITAIMARREIDDVDPNKILLLAGLGLFILLTPFVTGGLKPISTPPLVQNLVQALTPAASSEPVRASAVLRPHSRHRVAPKPVSLRAQEKLVAASVSDPGIPIIIIPTPPVMADAAESAKHELLVCRPPQHLPSSHLMGPQVCLPQQDWDRFKAQGLELMPDGYTLGIRYRAAAHGEIGCKNTASRVSGASNALATALAICPTM
jgi:beta-lactamase regulating signal transducer with metallopeptidase domain